MVELPTQESGGFGHSPRLLGIREQHKRALIFLAEASTVDAPVDKFRRLMASVYFCRAVVELMLESAKMEETTEDRAAVEELVRPLLPRYMLVEKLRIHDFHRFGVVPQKGVFMGGPMKHTAVKGYAVSQLTNKSIETSTTGDSKVSLQRPLLTRGIEVFDDEADEWLPVEKVVLEYVQGVPEAVKAFRSVLKNEYGGKEG